MEIVRDPLKGLDGIGVLVEGLTKEVEDKGLTRDALITSVELQLRKAGIKVLSKSERSAAPGCPDLYVNVSVMLRDSGLASYSISLQHMEWVLLERNGKGCSATTWQTHLMGTVGVKKLNSILEHVSELVDEYANDYLAANPIERKPATEKTEK